MQVKNIYTPTSCKYCARECAEEDGYRPHQNNGPWGRVNGVTQTEDIDKTKARKTREGPIYRPKMMMCSELSSVIISIRVPHLRLKAGVD